MTSSLAPSRALNPGLMVPPYTMMDGRFRRAMAMTVPGMFCVISHNVASSHAHNQMCSCWLATSQP